MTTFSEMNFLEPIIIKGKKKKKNQYMNQNATENRKEYILFKDIDTRTVYLNSVHKIYIGSIQKWHSIIENWTYKKHQVINDKI